MSAVPSPNGELASTDTPALAVHHVSKTFAGQRVLHDVALDVVPGEVHGLIGQNGSGKSTLIKILAGYHHPDKGGSGAINGVPFKLGESRSAHDAGLRFVHQDLGLVPSLGTLDNLALGAEYERNRLGSIVWRREAETARERLGRLGYFFDLRVPVARLAASERTAIAVARALGEAGSARVLVLDEPTASLPAAEVDRLFEVIAAVTERGVAVIFVSHRFGEVFEICHAVTVLRDGEHVGTHRVAALDHDKLIELTIGRPLDARGSVKHLALPQEHRTIPRLALHRLSGRHIRDLNLTVQAGEIVGVTGVTGSGREELAGMVYGTVPRQGQVMIDGQSLRPHRPDASVRAGMALVPADRLATGIFSNQTLRQNVTISDLEPYRRPAGLDRAAERADVTTWLARLKVVPQDTEAMMDTLSGGNQQKVVLARALRLKPGVLVLDEPTQGVDVGAKDAIHNILRQAASDGMAVCLVSTEAEELVAVCNRIVVLAHGREVANVAAGDVTPDTITELTIREDLRLKA